MKLVKTEVKFETLELLEEMVEVSNAQLNRSKNSYAPLSEIGLVSFNLGRQSGHTSAIIEYFQKHNHERSILVVTPTGAMGNVYRNAGLINVQSIYNIDRTVRNYMGVRLEGSTFDIIFDVCSLENIKEYLEMDNNVVETLLKCRAKINSIVAVASL